MLGEWKCFKCGAPLSRKKCDYCGARNNKNREAESSVEEKAPDVQVKSELPKATGGGCSDGCASSCAEGCLGLIGQVIIDAIGSLFDGC